MAYDHFKHALADAEVCHADWEASVRVLNGFRIKGKVTPARSLLGQQECHATFLP